MSTSDKRRNVASAVFETRAEAERAIDRLSASGISENAISVISKHDHAFERDHADHAKDDRHEHTDTKASGAGKGVAIGAGAGAIAGLAALAIPGVAPFFAAGAVAEALGIVGSTAATSAAVGGAIGGLTGALMKYGVDEEDARYFDEHLQRGGYWVGVDLDASRANRNEVEAILYDHGGHTSRRARSTDSPNYTAHTEAVRTAPTDSMTTGSGGSGGSGRGDATDRPIDRNRTGEASFSRGGVGGTAPADPTRQ